VLFLGLIVFFQEHRCDTATASMAKAYCTDLQGKKKTNPKVVCFAQWSLKDGLPTRLCNCTADVRRHFVVLIVLMCTDGFIWDTNVTRNYADARVQRIYGGTNEIMNELISRTI
jgi:alkylation response protein AidB-like acyl-CoA dehydrogenase